MNLSKFPIVLLIAALFLASACGGGDVVRVSLASGEALSNLPDAERAQIARIRETQKTNDLSPELNNMIKKTPHISAHEYIAQYMQESGTEGSDTSDYRVGGYDVLSITVYEDPSLSREAVRVSADGTLTFPLIGRVNVEGKTTAQIEDLIATKLTEGQYLVSPHVAVFVKEYLSKKALILGAVEKPGSYELRAAERVLDILSRAGGADPREGGNRITILRRLDAGASQGGKIAIDINLHKLVDGEDPQSNIPVQDRDVIHVAKAEKVFILGEVQKPGDYVITGRDVTLVEAIGMAGGFTKIAAPNRTKIIRVEEGVEKIVHVKVDEITGGGKKAQDISLKPNDIIVVPESFF